MKVLGSPKEWATQTRCRDCRTRVELGVRDLRLVHDQRDGDAVVWRCPECGRENWMAARMVPQSKRHLLR